jgi:hypothetical protein
MSDKSKMTKIEANNPMIIGRESLGSLRTSGFRIGRPVESFGPVGSGAWMTTCSLSVGTVMTVLHLGQGPFLPANFSLT